MAFSDAAEARHNLTGSAKAALEAVMLDKGSLQGVQLVAIGDAFDGGDLGTLMHDSEGKAGDNPLAVELDSAGAAGSLVAAFLGAGQIERLAQHIKERLPRINL